MHHPWQWYPDWEADGLEYYNVTRGQPGFDDYVSTLKAYYDNSMRVPSFAGFVILSLFGAVVLAATFCRLAVELSAVRRVTQRSSALRAWHAYISRAPLFRHHHARPVSLLGSSQLVTLQLPLRGQTVLLVALAVLNVVPLAAFYTPFRENNLYWTDQFVEVGRYLSDRSGILATAQLPPLILLSGRNNAVSWATGASFSTCMLYHRWLARWVFVQVLVHAIGYSIISVREGGVAEYHALFADPYLRWGVAAAVAFGPLIFLSLRWLRRASYEVFVLVHVAMALVCLVATYYHIHLLAVGEEGRYADFDNYLYASFAFYGIDKAARLARVLAFSVQLRPRLSVSRCTSDVISQSAPDVAPQAVILRHAVTLRGLAKGKARPASFVQLWLPRLQPFSSHPFTVADVHVDKTGASTTVYLYTKTHRGVTQKLHQRIIERQQQSDDASVHHLALVEGFYGQVLSAQLHARSLLVCGGIGVTLCMPLLLAAKRAGRSTQMVWVVREESILAVASDIFSRHEHDGEKEHNSDARLVVYITGSDGIDALHRIPSTGTASAQDHDDKDKTLQHSNDAVTTLHRAARLAGVELSLHRDGARPNLHHIVEDCAAETPGKSDLAVVSCGPTVFCDDVRQASNKLRLTYVEEAFEW